MKTTTPQEYGIRRMDINNVYIHIYFLLWHYATSRNVAGSIPGEIIEFFNWPNPSSRTANLGSTQPLAEMSTRKLPEGKGRPTGKANNNRTAICKPII
jgi:hypothetical protein